MRRLLSTIFMLFGVLLLLVSAQAQDPQMLWTMSLPQTFNSYPADVAATQNGEMIVGLNFKSGPQNGFLEAQAVARLNGAGAIEWVRYPVFGDNQKNFIHDVAVDQLGGVWVVGREGNPNGWDSPYILKLNGNGLETWRRQFPPYTNPSINRVLPLDDGTAIILGNSLSENEDQDGIAARVGNNGTLLWMHQFGGLTDDVLVDGIPYEDGFLFAGGRNQIGQYYDLYFVHTTQTGGVIWEQQLSDADLFSLNGIVPLPNGGFATLVSVLDVLWLQWFYSDGSPQGDLQLDLYFADSKFTSSPFQVMPDGGFLIGGKNDQGDAVLLRTDAVGATVWEEVYTHDDPDGTQAISVIELLPDGEIQFAGVKQLETESAWFTQLAPEGSQIASTPRVLDPFMTDNNVLTSDGGSFTSVNAQPSEFSLDRAYPNPFNATTTVSVNLPEAAELNVAVFNVAGQRVAELANGSYSAGTQRLVFDASGLSSGVYFIHAVVPGEFDQVQKVMLVR
ncbi:T9SS type A sorting domain-containing protein [bacterium]|nr:T9SS type A sorting domain-containing protein [bacterium]